MAKGKPHKKDTFEYMKRIRIMLMVITAILLVLIPISYNDPVAWVGGWPVITIVIIPIALFFIWVIWQDGGQSIKLTKDSIVWEVGAWKWHKIVEISWSDIAQLKDATTIFSVSRKYTLVSASDPDKRIKINSSLSDYRDLLKIILSRIPGEKINPRAKRSLQRIRLLKS